MALEECQQDTERIIARGDGKGRTREGIGSLVAKEGCKVCSKWHATPVEMGPGLR